MLPWVKFLEEEVKPIVPDAEAWRTSHHTHGFSIIIDGGIERKYFLSRPFSSGELRELAKLGQVSTAKLTPLKPYSLYEDGIAGDGFGGNEKSPRRRPFE